jgi:hypothetical protein
MAGAPVPPLRARIRWTNVATALALVVALALVAVWLRGAEPEVPYVLPPPSPTRPVIEHRPAPAPRSDPPRRRRARVRVVRPRRMHRIEPARAVAAPAPQSPPPSEFAIE